MKALLIGAGVALAAGMSMGFAMQPQLNFGDDRPQGPQMFAAWSGERSTGPFDPGTSFAAYRGQLPDYVIGTDWKKASTAWTDNRRAVDEELELARNDAEPPVLAVRAAWQEPPPAAASYPSVAGGDTYEADLPAPPQPPDADDDAPIIIG